MTQLPRAPWLEPWHRASAAPKRCQIPEARSGAKDVFPSRSLLFLAPSHLKRHAFDNPHDQCREFVIRFRELRSDLCHSWTVKAFETAAGRVNEHLLRDAIRESVFIRAEDSLQLLRT